LKPSRVLSRKENRHHAGARFADKLTHQRRPRCCRFKTLSLYTVWPSQKSIVVCGLVFLAWSQHCDRGSQPHDETSVAQCVGVSCG
jgi:hypothetical protein